MKKLLFLLLLSVSGYSQAVFDEGVQITGGQTTTSTTSKILSQESSGVVNTIDATNLPLSTATTNALFAKKDATSTAITSTATLTNNGTTFTLSPLTGVIVDNSTAPSTRTVINFAGASNVTPLYFRTLLYIDNTGTLQQMNGMTTDLTPQQRVDNLFIGIVVYSGGAVQVVQLIPDIEYSIDNRFSTLADFIRNINEGNNIGANGANLQVNKGAGYTFRRGSNFATNREVPDVTTDAVQTPIPASPNLIGYRNGSGGWTYEPYTGSLTPQFWDDGSGVKAAVANNKFTNQRVYFFNGTNTYVIYLGRTEHATLEAAATAAQSPDAIVDPATSVASLIGTISVAHNATALNNTAQAGFTQGPRMQGGTGAGGASGSQNLQNTYLNSSVPQITTTALGAVTVQRGSASDTDNIIVGKNGAGTTTFSVSGEGKTIVKTLEVVENSLGSVANEIKQGSGVNDWWKIYGKADVLDNSEMVFEVGDNGKPYADGGERFRFHYDNSGGGTAAKDVVIIDYNDMTVNARLKTMSNVQSDTYSVPNSSAYITGVDVGIAIGQADLAGGYGTWLQSMQAGGTSFPLMINPNGGNTTVRNAILTDTPTATTAPVGTNTTQIATTAFVQDNKGSDYKVSISGSNFMWDNIKNGTTTGYIAFDWQESGLQGKPSGFVFNGSNTQKSYIRMINASSDGDFRIGETFDYDGNRYVYEYKKSTMTSPGWRATNNLKLGTSTATLFTSGQYRLSALNTAPASASDTGTTGEIRVTATHIYICTATNTWVRTALSSW